MVKVFTSMENGKIEFTKEELERLLNDVWNDGYNHHIYHSYWWSTGTPYRSDYITVSCNGTKEEA